MQGRTPPSLSDDMKPAATRVLAYCRVSSDEQEQDTGALTSQEGRVRRHLDGAGLGEATIFSEIGSGTRSDRPVWQKVQSLLATGEYGHLVCTRLDRLGRYVGLDHFIKKLYQKGIVVHCFEEPLPDQGTSLGGFTVGLKSLLSILESDQISQRQRARIEDAMKHGTHKAGFPFGFARVNGQVVPDRVKRYCPLGQKPDREGEVYEGISAAELMQIYFDAVIRHRCRVSDYYLWLTENYGITRVGTGGGHDNRGKPIKVISADRWSIEYGLGGGPDDWIITQPAFPPKDFSTKAYMNPLYRGIRAYRGDWNPNLRPMNGSEKNKHTRHTRKTHYDIVLENAVEPLMSPEVASVLLGYQRDDRGNRLAKARRHLSVDRRNLAGLVVCRYCGHKMGRGTGTANRNGDEPQRFYQCRNPDCNISMCLPRDECLKLIALHLHKKAISVQKGIEPVPDLQSTDEADLLFLQEQVRILESLPVAAAEIKDALLKMRERMDALEGNAMKDPLAGTGHQLLLAKEAASWGYWEAALSDLDLFCENIQRVCSRFVFEWAIDDADAPKKRNGVRGRRSWVNGRPDYRVADVSFR